MALALALRQVAQSSDYASAAWIGDNIVISFKQKETSGSTAAETLNRHFPMCRNHDDFLWTKIWKNNGGPI